jgi:hypothetical protein
MAGIWDLDGKMDHQLGKIVAKTQGKKKGTKVSPKVCGNGLMLRFT